VILHGQLETKDYKKINKSILLTVNSIVQSKGSLAYLEHSLLTKAAQQHADYLSKQKTASVNQKSGKNKTVEGRIKAVKGEFDDALQLVIELPFTLKDSKSELEEKCIRFVNEQLNTPSKPINFANYSHIGIAWSKRKTENCYLISIVFAHEKVKVPNQLSKNGFGLKLNPATCTSILENHELTILTSCIYVEGNQVILEYQNKDRFKTLFPNPTDGIAIDIITEEQFPCQSPNQLDGSTIYDGVLLKPKYRDELLTNNQSTGDFRLKTVLGEIPTELVNQEILPNLIYIKNGQVCRYNVLHYIDGEPYGLAPIEPQLDERYSPLNEEGSVRTMTYNFEFEQGKTDPIGSLPAFVPSDSLMVIEILSFSSIEGSAKTNYHLHEERAKKIELLASKYWNKHAPPIKTTVAENWERCYFQLELLGLDSVAKQSKDSIRRFVVNDKTHNWDSLLNAQRISTLIFHIRGIRDSVTQRESFLNMNVRTALLQGNTRQANQAILKMYRENMPTSLLMEPGILDRLMTDTALVQNAAALFTNHFNPKDIRVIAFVRNWLRDPTMLSESSKRNLIHLYNLSTYTLLTEEWDIKTTLYLNLLNPKKLDEFFSTRTLNSVFDLNYYLTRLSYHELSGDYVEIEPCFRKIEAYFESQKLSIEEETKIALFFNLWSQPDLTIDLLESRMDNADFSADAAFLLAQTIIGNSEGRTQELIEKAVAKAYELNPEKWCEWVNFDFQIYRDSELKRLYCSSCR